MIDEPEIEPATPILAASETFRVLILDTKKHTDLLKAACKNAGHSVVAVHTIEEAFAFLDGRNHADVIICAAYLEDESMFEFLKRVRNSSLHRDSMFMILSLAPTPTGTRLNGMVADTGRHLGSDVFISMPVFDPEKLISEIKKLLPATPWLERSRLKVAD